MSNSEEHNELIHMYTDGSYKWDSCKGGYAAYFPQIEHVICGSKDNTTNNQMEIQAVISGLQHLEENSKVIIYSDSQYVCNSFNKRWIDKWEKNNWKRGGSDIPNKELWVKLKEQVDRHQEVTFQWVKGHASTYGNNVCDAFATAITKCND